MWVKNNKPFCFIFNTLVVFFFFKRKSIFGPFQSFFGLEQYLDSKVLQLGSSSFLIRKIYDSDFDAFRRNLIKELAESTNKRLAYQFSEIYRTMFKVEPTNQILQDFFTFFKEEDDDLMKTSVPGLANIMYRYFQRFQIQG